VAAHWITQLEQRDTQLLELQLKNQNLEEMIEELKRQIYSLPSQQTHEEFLKEKNELVSALALSKASLESIKRSESELRAKQDDRREVQISDATAAIALLEEEKMKLANRVDELNTQLHSLISSIPANSSEIDRLKAENIDLRRNVQELNMEKIRLIAGDTRPDSVKSAEVDQLRLSNRKLEESFQTEASKHSMARDKLIREKLFLEVELAKANKEIEARKVEISTLKAANHKEELEALRKKIDCLENRPGLEQAEALQQQLTTTEGLVAEVISPDRSFEMRIQN